MEIPSAVEQQAAAMTVPSVEAPLPGPSPVDVGSMGSMPGHNAMHNASLVVGRPPLVAVPGNDGTPSGPAANPLALRHERLQGTISKYVATSGWGFVRSHLFEGELGFKTESIMLECQNYEFQENEPVEFDVQSDERGRPHAVALKPMVGRKPNECIGQRYRGYVRRFADRWGFLNAAAFDGDLFVHRDNLLLMPEQLQDGQPPLRTGQAVEFDVALDDRGRTVAKQITTSALLRPCDWIGRRLHGYIRSFQGAWGFINSDRFAGDLFMHRDSLLAQYQGVELMVGTMVEFDVERDHHKKGGKNRLVARQVAVIHQPNAMQQPAATYAMPPQHQHHLMQQALPPDPMVYSTVPPMHQLPGQYGSSLNPQASTFAPLQTSPMYYQGNQPGAPTYEQQHLNALGYGQPPFPYPDAQYQQPVHPAQHLLPPVPQPGLPAQYQQPGLPQYSPYATAQPQQLPSPPAPVQPQMGHAQYPGHALMAQPQAYGLGPWGQALPSATAPQPGVLPHAPQAPEPVRSVPPVSQVPGVEPADPSGGDQPQVLLHITTHDWEPDQAGQLRVRKGTLVNVSHRAAHGWVYAATVQPGGDTGEPVAEGWVPQAVAKRVSLCRVVVDLIAVSKEAERGWVYGERISPRRPDIASDGWLPKKVLEYILT